MNKVRVQKQSLQRQASDYAIALALLIETAFLYGSVKLVVRLGLVHIQTAVVVEASAIRFKESRE